MSYLLNKFDDVGDVVESIKDTDVVDSIKDTKFDLDISAISSKVIHLTHDIHKLKGDILEFKQKIQGQIDGIVTSAKDISTVPEYFKYLPTIGAVMAVCCCVCFLYSLYQRFKCLCPCPCNCNRKPKPKKQPGEVIDI